MRTQPPASTESSETFAERIKLLIQRVGSATEIARMCGFSEGVVRSWRDGNTDPSRARCVKLARTLGISLVWLVAGEGSIQPDPTLTRAEEQTSSETSYPSRHRTHLSADIAGLPATGVDSARLNTAMKMLQSELDLAGSPLALADHADLLADLYAALGPGGVNVDAGAMLAFNRRLSERIRHNRASA
ncbi:transcription factor [Frateuria sp. Soil773]|uniref:helix-turn-helix domain-containing protein n=1 Tax=Frateuria sp. Soil773 TaxID=1736407 RepID=UPI0006F2ED4E|nr:helix-turn-helix transcriptional regulator [Frateuria sp. Soil773]KRF02256.1 transcription factor [Frateuria sp. Soil773]